MQPAIFLDRDNTLIANDGDLGDPSAVRLLDGVADGLSALHAAGYRLVVVTNQGGVARGKYTERDVDAVHQRIASLVDDIAGKERLIDRFYYCPYHPDATVEQYKRDHPWRKPNPGMLLQAARDMGIDLEASWLIGDQPRDIAAGRSAGCRTVLLRPEPQEPSNGTAEATIHARTFPEAVTRLLATPTPKDERPGQAQQTTRPATSDPPPADTDKLRRAVIELTEELHTARLRRGEFTPLRMAAAFCQLLALLLALQGLLQLGDSDLFLKWFAGAMLVQLATLTLLVLDLK